MVDVIPLPHADETIESFLRRAGPKSTAAIAGRFSRDVVSTRAVLKKLENEGKVESVMDTYTGYSSGGRTLVWRARYR